ncbi:M50 family metallopeptidase [bacterium]|nr:M50 family metallopeptidase [bacterium]
MNLGITIIIITILSYFSSYLNNKYLNFTLTRMFYFLGAFIHESSHALMCVLTGAKITEFKVFTKQPRVSHYRSKIPFLGQSLISLAPLAGGIFFLFLINKYLLHNYLILNSPQNFSEIFQFILIVLEQINFLEWPAWVIVLLSFNIGAMIGPSWQDLKNTWWIFPILFFVKWSFLLRFGFLIIELVLINILIQLFFILILKLFKRK